MERGYVELVVRENVRVAFELESLCVSAERSWASQK